MMRTRLLALALAVAGGLATADRAQAQVIYYQSPYYYHTPYNPLVRTWSTPYAYSTYVAPVVVPTRFTYPYWGQVTYGNQGQFVPAGATTTTTSATVTGTATTDQSPGSAATTAGPAYTPPAITAGTSSGTTVTTGTTAGATTGTGVQPVVYSAPAPAWVQVAHTTYTPAAVPIGSAYYTGDSYIAPSRYYYSAYGTPMPQQFIATGGQASTSGGFTNPYFTTSFGQGYGGWGYGRGWAGWGRGWGWGW